MPRLETRDLEILRTLARLHFASNGELISTFFSSDSAGHRRLRHLGSIGLIHHHTKGAPPRSNYAAWRLTARGIEALLREHPTEPVPDRLDERLAEQSLLNMERREAVSRIYLDLLRGDGAASNKKLTWQDVQHWIASMRQRANKFHWETLGEVVLQFRDLSTDYRIFPDAVLTCVEKPYRLFIGIDRYKRPLQALRRELGTYAAYVRAAYGMRYPDGKRPLIVYIARSAARKTTIEKIAMECGASECKVIVWNDAAAWLAEFVLDEKCSPAEPAPNPSPRSAAEEVLFAARRLLKSTSDALKRNPCVFQNLADGDPTTIERWTSDLRALSQLVRQGAPKHGG